MAELNCCALMGTVVHAGSGTAVVVASGAAAESGRISLGPGEHQPLLLTLCDWSSALAKRTLPPLGTDRGSTRIMSPDA